MTLPWHAETVKYFNNEALEVANLGVAVSEYQEIEFKLMASLAALNVLQSGIIAAGMSAGLILCVRVRSLDEHVVHGYPSAMPAQQPAIDAGDVSILQHEDISLI